MAGPRTTRRRVAKAKRRPSGRARRDSRRFVGRDASPVLDHYPPKDPSLSPRFPPAGSSSGPSLGAMTPPSRTLNSPGPSTSPVASAPGSGPTPLITLDRPFDVDEFAAMLGETSIRVTVPREALPEVLRRVMEFMGFGIYVYAVTVRPAPSELLKSFVVELQRMDYSVEKGGWVPFAEQGAGPGR